MNRLQTSIALSALVLAAALWFVVRPNSNNPSPLAVVSSPQSASLPDVFSDAASQSAASTAEIAPPQEISQSPTSAPAASAPIRDAIDSQSSGNFITLNGVRLLLVETVNNGDPDASEYLFEIEPGSPKTANAEAEIESAQIFKARWGSKALNQAMNLAQRESLSQLAQGSEARQ